MTPGREAGSVRSSATNAPVDVSVNCSMNWARSTHREPRLRAAARPHNRARPAARADPRGPGRRPCSRSQGWPPSGHEFRSGRTRAADGGNDGLQPGGHRQDGGRLPPDPLAVRGRRGWGGGGELDERRAGITRPTNRAASAGRPPQPHHAHQPQALLRRAVHCHPVRLPQLPALRRPLSTRPWAGAPAWALLVSSGLAGAATPQLGSMVRARWSALLGGSPLLHAAFSLESVADEVIFVAGPVLVTLLATEVHPASGIGVAVATCVVSTLWLAGQRLTEPRAARPAR